MKSFTRTDLRSLEYHKLIAKKLIKEPKNWNIVYSNLKNQCNNTSAYKEWETLINSKTKRAIIDILCEQSENSQRLRSSSPFLGILTDDERLRVFNSFKINRKSTR